MAKRNSVDDTLSKLAALKGMGPGVLAQELGRFLASKTSLVVSRAAEMAKDDEYIALAPAMIDAFWRFLKEPGADKGCMAKESLANALYEMGAPGPAAEAVFLAGIRHVQMEGSFGPPVDVAAVLRGVCALGLVRMGYRQVMDELADLLADRWPQARVMAARALAYAGHNTGAALLRLKLHLGDREVEVTCECLTALAKLAGLRVLTILTDHLRSSDEAISATAALSLGEIRKPEAFEALKSFWFTRPDPETRAGLLLPMALSRLKESLEFLIEVVATAPESLATQAIEALKIYRGDSSTRDRIAAAVSKRKSAALSAAFTREFEA